MNEKTLFVLAHSIEKEIEFDPLRKMGHKTVHTIFFNPCSTENKTSKLLENIKKEIGDIEVFFWKDISPAETLKISKGVSRNSNLKINFSRITESLQLEKIILDNE